MKNKINLKLVNQTLGPKELIFRQHQHTDTQRLLPSDANYLPFERMPGAELLHAANHCVSAALECSQQARAIFVKLIESWRPCFPPMYEDISSTIMSISNLVVDMMRYDAREAENKEPPHLEDLINNDKAERYGSKPDFMQLTDLINNFIIFSFNPKANLANYRLEPLNHHLKVAPEPKTAKYLISAITLRSFLAYAEFNLAEYDRKTRGEDGIILDTKFEDLKSSRKTKERRSQLINKFKAWGFALRHEAKLYQWAITWYKCRVNLGSIEQYVSDESERINQQANQLSDHELELYYHNGGETAYPERSNIENGIAPYDEATGYPRKWHE